MSWLWAGVVLAVEPEPPPAPDSLEARIAALEAQLAQLQQEALQRDAEAMAQPPPPPPAPRGPSFNALNPGITVFGDVVGQLGVADGAVSPGSTVYLRSLEIEMRADVDPFAKADVVIAFEQEAPPLDGGPGEGFGAEPEELYIDLVALPARLSARVGKFKVPFGIMNRMHPHDLPWTDAPELLGEEGYNDTGGTLAWLLPAGPVALTVTAGLFGGEGFDPEGERANGAGLGRAELFVGTGPAAFSVGGSVLQDLGGTGRALGGDATLRWKPNQRRSVVVLGELVDADGLRGYAAVQVQPARMWYVGFREDFGDTRHNLYVSSYTSEFLRVRVGGGYTPATAQIEGLAQLTFVWGSHPVEPWWVNR